LNKQTKKKPSESKTSSTTGTNSTDKMGLSSTEICTIIASCATNKVAVLKFGELYLRFGPTAEPDKTSTLVPAQNQNIPDTKISDEQHDKTTAETVEDEATMTREEQLAMALVEDPMLHEQLLRDGDLDDTDESGNE